MSTVVIGLPMAKFEGCHEPKREINLTMLTRNNPIQKLDRKCIVLFFSLVFQSPEEIITRKVMGLS